MNPQSSARPVWRACLAVAGSLVFFSSVAQAGFTVTTVSDPGDLYFTQLLGINNSGTIAGSFGDGTSVARNGFTLTLPSSFTAENFPGSVQTQVFGINTAGDTVGYWVDASGNNNGFIDIGGTFSTVDNPGSTTFNQLLGVNSSDEAAGFYAVGSAQTAYTFHGGTFTSLAGFFPSGTTVSEATDVNNAGEVVGFYGSSGFLLNGTTLTTLMVAGSLSTEALGVNNNGQVVGEYIDSGGVKHGFLWNGTTFTPFDISGATATTINGINDSGQIVGYYVDASGDTIGFEGNPASTPEPATFALLSAGLLALGLRANARRGRA